MATKLKSTIGTIPCRMCRVVMPVKQSENGTLDLSCKFCDFSGYAKVGTEAHQIAIGEVTHRPESAGHKPAAVAKAVAEAVNTPVTPAPRKRNSIFDI